MNHEDINTLRTTSLEWEWLSLVHDIITDEGSAEWGGHRLAFDFDKEQIGDEQVWVLTLWRNMEKPLARDHVRALRSEVYGEQYAEPDADDNHPSNDHAGILGDVLKAGDQSWVEHSMYVNGRTIYMVSVDSDAVMKHREKRLGVPPGATVVVGACDRCGELLLPGDDGFCPVCDYIPPD